ncbi:MAG: hypothetical protein IH798_01460 [Gemmatimonadetes bacterium]|nr:hypothetical protein [Gemmatimonadota bacterium]
MRFTSFWLAMMATVPGAVRAQVATAESGPVIDTIVVITQNVFGAEEARSNKLFRIANAIRFTTRTNVVRRELLFKRGEVYDSAIVAESERNLRAFGIFRDAVIDSSTVDGKLVVTVRTFDGWSTQFNLNGGFTEGTFTWSVVLAEQNFGGTATLVDVSYRKEPDRTATRVGTRLRRAFASSIAATGFYESLSDGKRGAWAVGSPFRAFIDRHAIQVTGERADHRVLKFVTRSAIDQDTVEFNRRVFVNRVDASVAPIATTGRYLRTGISAQVKREEFVPWSDRDLAFPDTITGTVGFFAEYRQANFKVVTHYNGFAQTEDLDLSTTVRLTTWLAPSAFGYERSGVGPRLSAAAGASLPFGFLRGSLLAGGLFTSAGLDSGRVVVRMTLGSQFFSRQATFLHVQAGMMERPTPGREFDLGHGIGPRLFGPHSLTGDRAVWGTFEHRVFLVDEFLGLLGLGAATFIDYGGAWFDGIVEPQFGGNVGFGLRLGATRATGINVGRFDLGYRFGEGWSGNRWAFSIGRGFLF